MQPQNQVQQMMQAQTFIPQQQYNNQYNNDRYQKQQQ
jgi:hypothetical protein